MSPFRIRSRVSRRSRRQDGDRGIPSPSFDVAPAVRPEFRNGGIIVRVITRHVGDTMNTELREPVHQRRSDLGMCSTTRRLSWDRLSRSALGFIACKHASSASVSRPFVECRHPTGSTQASAFVVLGRCSPTSGSRSACGIDTQHDRRSRALQGADALTAGSSSSEAHAHLTLTVSFP